jgi:succinate dehydrogenase / fumarate reductase membrane anchor subunit
MSLQSPLGKFLGHGSAKSGTEHWWAQRVTSVALVPLCIWFVFALLGMGDDFSHASVAAWIAQPFNAIGLILLVITLLYHSQLGMQVVFEDYVHTGWLYVSTMMVSKFAHVAAGVACLYSIVIISVGTAS